MERTSLVDAPHRYIETGFQAILLLLVAGTVLAVTIGGLNASGFPDVLSALSLSFLVGAIIGLLIVLAVLVAIIAAFFAIHRDHEVELEIDLANSAPEPQPYIVQDRIIPVNHPVIPEPPETINGIPAIAWEYFVGQLARGVPISQNHWDRHQLPGGYEIASFDSYSHLVDPLVELGIIADRDGERRKSGRLTTTDPAAIMAALREWERNHERRS